MPKKQRTYGLLPLRLGEDRAHGASFGKNLRGYGLLPLRLGEDRAHGARPSAPRIDLATPPATPAGSGRRMPAAPARPLRKISPERCFGAARLPLEGGGALNAYVSDSILPSAGDRRTRILPSCRTTCLQE